MSNKDVRESNSNQKSDTKPESKKINEDKGPQPTYFLISIWLFINLVSSIVIVFQNKYIYAYIGFPNISLTGIHFIVTFLMLEVIRIYGMFEKKGIPFYYLFMLSLSFCGFVALTNLSLQFNTVGTSQVIKVLTIPTFAVLEYLYYQKAASMRVYATFVSSNINILLLFESYNLI